MPVATPTPYTQNFTTAGTAVCQGTDLVAITVSKYLVFKLNGTPIHTSTVTNSGTFYGRYMSQGTIGVKIQAELTTTEYKWTYLTNPATSDSYVGINDNTGTDWGSVWGFYPMGGTLWVGYTLLEGAGNYSCGGGTPIVPPCLASNHTVVSGDVLSIEYA